MSVLATNKFLKRKSLLGKVLRFPFSLIPDSAIVPILSGPMRGWKWIKGSHNLSNIFGKYEVEQTRYFVANTKNSKVMWDLGAHVGYYSLLYLSQTQGEVYSFEPSKRNSELFKRHMKANGCTNFKLFDVAVSDKTQVLRFTQSRTSVAGRLSENGEVEVQAIKLSSWWKEGKIRPADVIKMDIEGAEYSVLQDLKEYLITYSPIIFLSTHGQEIHDSCINLLKELGYQIFPMDNGTIENSREVLAKRFA